MVDWALWQAATVQGGDRSAAVLAGEPLEAAGEGSQVEGVEQPADAADGGDRKVPGGVCVLTLHPESVGRGPRLLVLERFIEHVRRLPDVEFRLMREVADEFRAEQKSAVAGARS